MAELIGISFMDPNSSDAKKFIFDSPVKCTKDCGHEANKFVSAVHCPNNNNDMFTSETISPKDYILGNVALRRYSESIRTQSENINLGNCKNHNDIYVCPFASIIKPNEPRITLFEVQALIKN